MKDLLLSQLQVKSGGTLPKLAVIAVILASFALVISIAQPTYNFFVGLNGKPSFQIYLLSLDEFATTLSLYNNGTTAAHNVAVRLYFIGPNTTDERLDLSCYQHTSELQNNNQHVVFSFPIGEFQLQDGGWNVTQYTLNLDVSCDELPSAQTAHFSYNATSGLIVVHPIFLSLQLP